MKIRISSIGLVAAFTFCMLGLYVQPSEGFPKPSLVPKSWDLDIKYGKPDTVAVNIPGQSGTQLFYYLPYTVTNKTGGEQMFIPRAQLLTNRGQLLTAGRKVHPNVFKTIKKNLDNPLLMSRTQIVGIIRKGPDHAKDGLFIWPVPAGKDIDLIRIFVEGLSGETEKVTDPVTNTSYILRKTHMLEYRTPGDAPSTPIKSFIKKKSIWIMR